MNLSPEHVLGSLGRGRANGLSVHELVCKIRHQLYFPGMPAPPQPARPNLADQRKVRELVEQLRREGHPICATPRDGYFLANTAEELDETCRFLRERALTSLVQIAQLRRKPLPELMGQLALDIARAQGETA